VAGEMSMIVIDSIDYRLFYDGNAVIQSCNELITALIPRNCVIFNGVPVSVTHLQSVSLAGPVKTLLIPNSLHTISDFDRSEPGKLEYLVFESGTELDSIPFSAFSRCCLPSLFLPRSVRFIGETAFAYCNTIASVHFDRQSSLRQLSPELFSELHRIYTITIPSSIKRIYNGAFEKCRSLRIVQFELPSQCWRICARAFEGCRLLEPISLPSSVEFIEYPHRNWWTHCFPIAHNSHNFLIRDDCVIRGRELIRSLGSSETFCVSREITVLGAGSFSEHSSLTTLTFERPSRVTHLLHESFFWRSGLRSIEIPKSVRFIGDFCFSHCAGLTELVFESPASLRRIESGAFSDCISLTSFGMPSSVSSLGDSLFERCKKLSSVTFEAPSRLTNLPDRLFYCCRLLTTLALPDSVTSVGHSAFADSGVISITSSDWTITAGFVVRLGTVFGCLGTPSSLRIPGSVREIGDSALSQLHSLVDLSFEEGTLRIGVSAFSRCFELERAVFPASLAAIEADAFRDCRVLCQIAFAPGSQLRYIRSGAFLGCDFIEDVVLASDVEIDPLAFSRQVWHDSVTFEGFLIDDYCIQSVDARVLVGALSEDPQVLIGSGIEVIGANAFQCHSASSVLFVSGTRLSEIGSGAFAGCEELREFKVPESVEILGDRCFETCLNMETIEFEESSRLRKIGEKAFGSCKLHSITIPALTEEIDGSAFADCPLITIRIAPENPNFKVEGNLLMTSDGTEIVRCFGRNREIIVGRKVKVLGKSCFEGCKHLDRIGFEVGSELESIGPAALRDCDSLVSIEIPVSVTIIEEASFEGCTELESCLMNEDSSLAKISEMAFANCTSLRSFYVPRRIGAIGSNCFNECIYLYQLTFGSSQSLKRVIGDRLLDDALDDIGVSTGSGLFRIGVQDDGVELKFAGWVSLPVNEGDLHLTLVRDLQ
jgi:hypothetical protein